MESALILLRFVGRSSELLEDESGDGEASIDDGAEESIEESHEESQSIRSKSPGGVGDLDNSERSDRGDEGGGSGVEIISGGSIEAIRGKSMAGTEEGTLSLGVLVMLLENELGKGRVSPWRTLLNMLVTLNFGIGEKGGRTGVLVWFV